MWLRLKSQSDPRTRSFGVFFVWRSVSHARRSPAGRAARAADPPCRGRPAPCCDLGCSLCLFRAFGRGDAEQDSCVNPPQAGSIALSIPIRLNCRGRGVVARRAARGARHRGVTAAVRQLHRRPRCLPSRRGGHPPDASRGHTAPSHRRTQSQRFGPGPEKWPGSSRRSRRGAPNQAQRHTASLAPMTAGEAHPVGQHCGAIPRLWSSIRWSWAERRAARQPQQHPQKQEDTAARERQSWEYQENREAQELWGFDQMRR